MEQLKNMKQTLMNCVQGQLGDLKNTDTKELGEAIDMIKDLEEAMYYCSIVKAMEDSDKEKSAMRYTYPPVMYNGGNMNMNDDRMYYNGGGSYPYGFGNNMNGNRGGERNYSRMYYDERISPEHIRYDDYYPVEMRDYREGRSPRTRRMYMESKELHQGKEKQMKELEEYMQELTHDIMEMIADSTPEEKTMLSQKLTTLAGKVQ